MTIEEETRAECFIVSLEEKTLWARAITSVSEFEFELSIDLFLALCRDPIDRCDIREGLLFFVDAFPPENLLLITLPPPWTEEELSRAAAQAQAIIDMFKEAQ